MLLNLSLVLDLSKKPGRNTPSLSFDDYSRCSKEMVQFNPATGNKESDVMVLQFELPKVVTDLRRFYPECS